MNKWFETNAKKLIERIRNKPYTSFIILVFIIPVLIWFVYWIGDNHFILVNTSLSVGDALGFYGSVLSFVSTTILGIIAVWQNIRLQKLEENTLAKNNSCNMYLTDCSKPVAIHLSHDGDNEYEKSNEYITITVNNCSEVFLKDIQIDFNGIIFHSNLTIKNGDTKDCRIFLPKNYNADITDNHKHEVVFTSCYGVKTYGDITVEKKDGHMSIKHYHFYGTKD